MKTKELTFREALMFMKKGYKVSCEEWSRNSDSHYLIYENDEVIEVINDLKNKFIENYFRQTGHSVEYSKPKWFIIVNLRDDRIDHQLFDTAMFLIQKIIYIIGEYNKVDEDLKDFTYDYMYKEILEFHCETIKNTIHSLGSPTEISDFLLKERHAFAEHFGCPVKYKLFNKLRDTFFELHDLSIEKIHVNMIPIYSSIYSTLVEYISFSNDFYKKECPENSGVYTDLSICNMEEHNE
jgi:hypothetical protein